MPLKYKVVPIFKISVKEGKTSMADSEYSRYRKWCLSQQGEFEFIIQKKFKKRSLPQNNYYWGVMLEMIAQEIGEEPPVVHAYLKAKFLSKELIVAGKDGQWDKTIVAGRTSKLKTDQFGEYLLRVTAWAANFLGLEIPPPDPEYASAPILISED